MNVMGLCLSRDMTEETTASLYNRVCGPDRRLQSHPSSFCFRSFIPFFKTHSDFFTCYSHSHSLRSDLSAWYGAVSRLCGLSCALNIFFSEYVLPTLQFCCRVTFLSECRFQAVIIALWVPTFTRHLRWAFKINFHGLPNFLRNVPDRLLAKRFWCSASTAVSWRRSRRLNIRPILYFWRGTWTPQSRHLCPPLSQCFKIMRRTWKLNDIAFMNVIKPCLCRHESVKTIAAFPTLRCT